MRARRLNCKAQEIALTATASSARIESPASAESFASAIMLRPACTSIPCSRPRNKLPSKLLTRKLTLAISLVCLGLVTQNSLADSDEETHVANGSTSPLLGMVENLACAVSPEEAQSALSRLKQNRVEAWSLPNEWYGQSTEPALYAASFDLLLLELLKIPEKFPVMQNRVEDLLLSWNYCLIQSHEGYFNLGTTRRLGPQTSTHTPARTPAHPHSPGNWLGFGQLGFPTPADVQPPERYVPESLNTESQTSLFKQKRFWSLYTTQCFPHPDTGAFYYRLRPFGPTRLNTVDSKSLFESAEAYPFDWQSSCDAVSAQKVLASTDNESSTAVAEVDPSSTPILNEAVQSVGSEPETDEAAGDQKIVVSGQDGNQVPALTEDPGTVAAEQSEQANNSTPPPPMSAGLSAPAVGTETRDNNTVWAKILDKPDAEILRIGKLKRQNPSKTKWLSALSTAARERARTSVTSPRLSDTITDERVARLLDSSRETIRIQEFESKRRLSRMRSLRVQISRQTAAARRLSGTTITSTASSASTQSTQSTRSTRSTRSIESTATQVETYGQTHADRVLFDVLSKKRLQEVRSERVRISRIYTLAHKKSNLPAADGEIAGSIQADRSIVFRLVSNGDATQFFEAIDSFIGNEPVALRTTGSHSYPNLAAERFKRLQTSRVRRVQESRVSANGESAEHKFKKITERPALVFESSKRLRPVKAARVRLSRNTSRSLAAAASALTRNALSNEASVLEPGKRAAGIGHTRRTFGEIYRNIVARAREPHRRITLYLSARPGAGLVAGPVTKANGNPADVMTATVANNSHATVKTQRRTFWEIYQSLMARAREPHRRITITLSARSKRDLTGATTVAVVTDDKRVHELPNKHPDQFGIFPANRRGRRLMTRATIWHVIKSRQFYRNRHNPRWSAAYAYEIPLRSHPAAAMSKRRHAVRVFGLDTYLAMGNGGPLLSAADVGATAANQTGKTNKEQAESILRPPLEGPVLAALAPVSVPASANALGASTGDTALFVTTPGANGGNVSPIANVPPHRTSAGEGDHFHGFSGSIALNNTKLELGEEDNYSITSSVAYKPIKDSFFFLRSGITLNNSDEPLSYTWGIGYDDWHPGTWGFEINNWNPLNPGDGLDFDNAVASLTRKFKADFLQNNNLASSLSLNKSANSEFALTWLVSWSPRPNWFVRTLITQSLEGNGTSWAYGFGYNNWRKNTVSLEYNNWGFNEAFDTNFRENALITLSYKWEF